MKFKQLFLVLSALAFFLITNAQVNLQNGAAQASIPLYSYSDPNNRIGAGISLEYIAGNGLPVSSVASNVGTGWNLNCGGYIERIQHGEPDDQKNNDTYTYPVLPLMDPLSEFWVWAAAYFPNGYLYADYNTDTQIPNAAGYTAMYPKQFKYYKPEQKYLVDREQDIFKFTFNGRVGYFVIGKKDGNGINTIKTLYDSKLKITKVDGDLNNNQDIRTTISQFKITDENGIEYLFADADLDQVCDYNAGSDYDPLGTFEYHIAPIGSTAFNSDHVRVIKALPRNMFVKNRWNLTQIKNPLSGVKIEFQYENVQVEFEGQKIVQSISIESIPGNQVAVTVLKTLGIAKRLKAINLSGNERVEFHYSVDNRKDLVYDNSLAKISIKFNNQEKYGWNFQYGYFNKTLIKDPSASFTDEDRVWARLCLVKLNKSVASQNEPPYSFEYFRGNENGMNSAVPPMFSAQQDLAGYYSTNHMGFYNPTSNTVSQSNAPYEPFGDKILPKSVYNTILGGLAYDPMSNNFAFMEPTIEARNGLIKSIQYPLGGKIEFEYEQNVIGITSEKKYFGVRVNKTALFDGLSNDNTVIKEYKYKNEDGSSSGWGYEARENKQTVVTGIGDCDDKVALINLNSLAVPAASYFLSPGMTVGAYPNTFSIGKQNVPTFAAAFFLDIVISILNGFFGQSGPAYTDFNVYQTTSGALTNGNDLPFQYSRVEIIDKIPTGTNGRVVYEFTFPGTSPAYAIDFPILISPFSSKQRFAYWLFGSPKNVFVYDKNGTIVKKTVNDYSIIKNIPNTNEFQSQKWLTLHPVNGCSFRPTGSEPTQYDKISSEIYYPIFGRIELTNSKEYIYNSNNESSVVETNYSYSADNYQISKVSSTNSKNEAVETNTYYPADYTLSGVIQTMKDKNILNAPIATQSVITKNGSKFALSGNISEYGVIGNGDIRALKNYTFQSAQPVSESAVAYSPGALIPSNVYYQQQGEISYNLTGFPEQIISKNRKVGKLFSYGNNLVLADLVNASGSEAFFDSFEEPGTWDGVQYDNINVRSGKYSARLTNNTQAAKSFNSNRTLNILLTHDTKFKVSGWVYNETSSTGYLVLIASTDQGVIASSNYLSTPEKNKWVYLEDEVTVPSNATKLVLQISHPGMSSYGSTWFDDMRINPSDARMTTYTYDPLVGITSQTDPNHRSVFYEYDGMGRLMHTKDQDHNILKKYCYNFAGQSESCPILTVGNEVKSKVFAKNNCETSTGSYGTEVTYSVPANKYYGGTQPEADALALAEIDNEGQVYANLNGTCLQGFTNDQKSGIFTRNNCTYGRTGSVETYVVPAGKHAAATKTEANNQADMDVANNGLNYAIANGTCMYYSLAINENFYSTACASNQTPVVYPVIVAAGAYTSFSFLDQADIQARNFAQLQANLYGSCAASATIVYARLEIAYSYSDNTSNYNSTYDATENNYYQWVSGYLRFYSDAACTLPYTLTGNIDYTINSSGYYETESDHTNNTGSTYVQGVALAGNSEVFFDDILPFEGFYGVYDPNNGYIFYEKTRDDFSIGSLGSGCVIRPGVYPQHSSGY